jgi:hypothetical protein
MYETVLGPQRRGDSGLVASKSSVVRTQPGPRPRRIRQWNIALLLLGCALFAGGCAHDDSADDNGPHRRHRHGDGRNREQMETIDRSDSPSPTPALGW